MSTAIFLSVGLGVVWGIIAMFATMKYLCWLLQANRKRETIRQKTLAMYGFADDDGDSILHDDREKDDPRDYVSESDTCCGRVMRAFTHLTSNPFSRPISLIDDLVVFPLRRRYVNALQQYIVKFIRKSDESAPKTSK